MKQTIYLGTLSAINIALSFLFQWHILTELGAGTESDAFFAGMTLPQLVLTVISGSLMYVLVPLLSGEKDKHLRHDAWGFFILVGGAFGILAILFFVTAKWWVPFTVPGFDENGLELTVELTRIQLVGMVFTAVNGVQLATYHAKQQFIWAESSVTFSNATAFVLLFAFLPSYGVVAASWINLFRMILQTLLLSPGMGRPLWPNLRAPAIQSAWLRIKPLLLGAAYYKSDPLVDRYLLSTSGSGNLSLFYLAQQIYAAVNQVLMKALATPLVPMLTRYYKEGNRLGFRQYYNKTLLRVLVISFFGIFVLYLFGKPVLELLVGYGKIESSKVCDLWWIMIGLCGAFIGGAIGQVLSSFFYTIGDTKTPTLMSIVTFTIYIPCKIISYYSWGVFGLALITSAYQLLNCVIMAIIIERKPSPIK